MVVNFYVVYMDMGVVILYCFGGQFGYGKVQWCGCDVGGFLLGYVGGNLQQFIQVEVGDVQFGQGDMVNVWWVECVVQ